MAPRNMREDGGQCVGRARLWAEKSAVSGSYCRALRPDAKCESPISLGFSVWHGAC